MQEAVTLVEGLNNVQAVTLVKQLYNMLYTEVPYDTVQSHLLLDVDEVLILRDIDLETKKRNLTSQDSVEAARLILMAFAEDDDLAPVLMQAWKQIERDDRLFIETMVAVGLLANLTLFMATTEMSFEFRGVSFKKGPASPEVLEEVLKPVVELIKKLP